MRRHRFAMAVLLASLVATVAKAQSKDVSLETLARAMEGRLGIYAKNLTTGDEIAINADKLFPTSEPGTLLQPSRHEGTVSRPTENSPRKVGECMAIVHRSFPRKPDDPTRRFLLLGPDRTILGGGLSPTIEMGGATWANMPGSPGITGYAACPAGDMVFTVLSNNVDSSFTAAQVFPEIVQACFRRLVPGFSEMPVDPKAPGLILASLHERDQDARLFPQTPERSAAESRNGSRRVKFRSGEVARLAVLASPIAETVATVQWWSPSDRPESCASQVLRAEVVGDAVFDLPVDKMGLWRVRVAFGDSIVLDEKFYVTAK